MVDFPRSHPSHAHRSKEAFHLTTMSTRTTRAQAAAASTSASSPPPKPVANVKGPSTSNKQANAHPEKENEKSAPKPRTKAVKRSKKVYCTCKGSDDGRPMIECVECQDWCVFCLRLRRSCSFQWLFRFHFSCINLFTREAEDIGEHRLRRRQTCLTYLSNI